MIRLAIIGSGNMANLHAQAFAAIKGCRVVACCDIIPARAEALARRYRIPAAYADARLMLQREKLDGVSIVTPDNAHAAAALLALQHGLHVMCEKPLADNLAAARRMAAAARRHKRLTAVNFSYRNNPATQQAAALVAAGRLGRIIHVEGSYLQSWLVNRAWGDWHTDPTWQWRLSSKHGSAGTLGDIGVHLYDLAAFVVGDLAELACVLKTFAKDKQRIGPYVFDVNDSAISTVRFKNGALGTLHTTRWGVGHQNAVALRVYGDKGALDLNLDRPPPATLRVCCGRAIHTARWQPWPCPITPNNYQRFVTSLRTGRPGQTSFADGLKVQAYLAASFISSKNNSKFVAPDI